MRIETKLTLEQVVALEKATPGTFLEALAVAAIPVTEELLNAEHDLNPAVYHIALIAAAVGMAQVSGGGVSLELLHQTIDMLWRRSTTSRVKVQ